MSLAKVTSGVGAACPATLPRGAATPAVAAKARDHPIVTAAVSRRCDSVTVSSSVKRGNATS